MEQNAAEWEWIAGEVREAADDFATQLRGVTDTSLQVPNLDWDVAGLAAHLVSLPRWHRNQNALTEFQRPDDFAQYSIDMRAHIVERDADALANLLVAEHADMLDELAADPWAPRTLYGRTTNGYNAAAALLAELKLHGMDLGRLTGAKVVLERRQAVAAIRQAFVVAPVFVDQAKARKYDGVYGLRFRGGDDYTYRIADGELVVTEGRPDRADARLRADPVTFMLLSLGRTNPVVAGLLGRVIIYGRQPWKLARTNTIVIDGV